MYLLRSQGGHLTQTSVQTVYFPITSLWAGHRGHTSSYPSNEHSGLSTLANVNVTGTLTSICIISLFKSYWYEIITFFKIKFSIISQLMNDFTDILNCSVWKIEKFPSLPRHFLYLNVHKLRFGECKFVYLPKSVEKIIVKGVLIKYRRAGPTKPADKSSRGGKNA